MSSICAAVIGLSAVTSFAQNKSLDAVFTSAPITVDGHAEDAWSKAAPAKIAICAGVPQGFRPGQAAPPPAPPPDCKANATVQALWNGPLLYLLFNVTDPNIVASATADTRTSGVQVFVDQYDDKFPKFEEDDGSIFVSATSQQTGNRMNADLPYFPAVWQAHLASYAASLRTDAAGNKIGYTVEVAWAIGDRPLKNGTRIGMEFSVSGDSGGTAGKYQLFWSSGNNKGTNDNTMWGDVQLTGYDGSSPMPLNTFMLRQNIRKATPAESSADGLVQGIWTSEAAVDGALKRANGTLASGHSQTEIDSANTALDSALRGLRRAGKYPDPYDLPTLNTLPDPFTFFNGKRVRTFEDWNRRRAEIKDLAQYYEFGFMPPAPHALSVISTSDASGVQHYNSINVTVEDKGKTVSFQSVLFLPSTGTAPYPVIVAEDFTASPNGAAQKATFLKGGYAVLSIPTSDMPRRNVAGIASDDGNHTGAFYTLYPYKLDAQGDDRGVLLAWAWGASRGVDALAYLAAHDPAYKNLLDLSKLVVTGFSRWGKASLLAGMLDDRFQVTAPGGSGSGGAAPYRYDSFGNRPYRSAPYGNVYPWGRSTGSETMGDHVRHQTHNSNEMIRRFLNDTEDSVEPRMYLTNTWGYGDRLPFDHHEEIAAIAPRAVLIDNTDDDFADNAEGDSIGYEGAMPVYKFLGVPQNLALDLYMKGGGHSLKPAQAQNIVNFADFVLFGKPLADDVKKQLTTDPYLGAGTYDTYYGGLKTMMPWAAKAPIAKTASRH